MQKVMMVTITRPCGQISALRDIQEEWARAQVEHVPAWVREFDIARRRRECEDTWRRKEFSAYAADFSSRLSTAWTSCYRVTLGEYGTLINEEIRTDLVAHDVLERLLADVALDVPRGEDVALVEDVLDLLERASGRLGEHEEDMDEGGEVERAEDEIRLVRDRGETGGNRPREREVEHPVRSCACEASVGA